jgi:hypothetical protein
MDTLGTALVGVFFAGAAGIANVSRQALYKKNNDAVYSHL